jgi:hypothetical protein
MQDVIQAYMWWSLAAPQGEETATAGRDQLAKLMTPIEIGEAQRLARQWKPNK